MLGLVLKLKYVVGMCCDRIDDLKMLKKGQNRKAQKLTDLKTTARAVSDFEKKIMKKREKIQKIMKKTQKNVKKREKSSYEAYFFDFQWVKNFYNMCLKC